MYVYYTYTYIKSFPNRFLYDMKKLSVHHIHHVPKCLSCHKAILVMIGRTHCFHCFHDYICVIPILLVQDWSTLCVVSIYIYGQSVEDL